MPAYDSIFTGAQIDEAIQKYFTIKATNNTIFTPLTSAGTSGQFLRGDGIWSNTITATFHFENGGDINFHPHTNSDNCGDIIWLYENNNEKARLWTDDTYTSAKGLNYRMYSSDGTALYTGTLVPTTGVGATGTWSISVTGYANSLLNLDGRRTTANYMFGDGLLRYYLATASMSSADGYPGEDGFILHGAWDWGGGYDSEFCFTNSGHCYIRGGGGGGDTTNHTQSWRSWYRLVDTGGSIQMLGNLNANTSACLGTLAQPWHQLVLGGTTSATMSAASTNPRITFAENIGTQPVHLIYCDFDSYRAPAGLKVVGDSGASSSPAWFEVEGAAYGKSWNNVSSRYIKTNISNITNTEALKILNINIVTFDYKENWGDINQVGVIAEDVQTILPNITDKKYPEDIDEETLIKGIENGTIAPMAIDYSKFTPYLIKLAQIQQQEINELKEKITQLF